MKDRYYCFYPSPIGLLIIEANDRFLLALHLTSASFASAYAIEEPNLPLLVKACSWLDAYFQQNPLPFELPYSLEGLSAFQQEVLQLVQQIPYGQTWTYKKMAEKIASLRHIEKMSAQAVGQALGKNPLPLFIPCHRVIGMHGLGGYSGGVDRKRFLLRLEQAL